MNYNKHLQNIISSLKSLNQESDIVYIRDTYLKLSELISTYKQKAEDIHDKKVTRAMTSKLKSEINNKSISIIPISNLSAELLIKYDLIELFKKHNRIDVVVIYAPLYESVLIKSLQENDTKLDKYNNINSKYSSELEELNNNINNFYTK